LLGQGVRRRAGTDRRSAVPRRGAVRTTHRRDRARSRDLGNRLAAPERQGDAERRRSGRPHSSVCAGARAAAEDPGRQSGAAVRVLKEGCAMADKRERHTMSRRRASFAGMAALAAALLLPQIADAQNYPNRPVRLILPFGAGGVADVTARLVTEKLGEKLGQRFVIENMAGGRGLHDALPALSARPARSPTAP